MLNNILRYLYFFLIVRPFVMIVIGLNVRRGELLPKDGPAIVVANHNSHLDAMVLMSLFGTGRLHKVHPVAAADHFLRNKFLAWFSTKIIGIIPLNRDVRKVRDKTGARADPLAGITEALERGEILILFPEGSRGEPEVREEFKTGIAHIAKRHPDVPITPVFLHGLGKSLPKGEGFLVPFFCDVFIGEPVSWTGERESFMNQLNGKVEQLQGEVRIPSWQ